MLEGGDVLRCCPLGIFSRLNGYVYRRFAYTNVRNIND